MRVQRFRDACMSGADAGVRQNVALEMQVPGAGGSEVWASFLNAALTENFVKSSGLLGVWLRTKAAADA
jgi:hypothetical protein